MLSVGLRCLDSTPKPEAVPGTAAPTHVLHEAVASKPCPLPRPEDWDPLSTRPLAHRLILSAAPLRAPRRGHRHPTTVAAAGMPRKQSSYAGGLLGSAIVPLARIRCATTAYSRKGRTISGIMRPAHTPRAAVAVRHSRDYPNSCFSMLRAQETEDSQCRRCLSSVSPPKPRTRVSVPLSRPRAPGPAPQSGARARARPAAPAACAAAPESATPRARALALAS